MTPYNRAIFLLNPSKRKDRKGEVSAQSCLKYSSRVCIILVLEKTKSVNVSRGKYAIKTGMPRLTITNHSELYPEVLNSLNEMSEYLHDKIRKHAIKQARRNHSVFPSSSAKFSVPWFIISSLAQFDIQESDVKIKGTAANCVAIASAVIVRSRNALALHYRISTVLSKLTTKILVP